MNNEYYVYLHRRTTDNKVFYVGKGKDKRAFDSYSRNAYWENTVNKHGLTVEIIYSKLSEEDALSLEKETIAVMRENFPDTLCNMTDGGEGISGYKWLDMSKHNWNRLNRIPRTPEQQEIISAKLRGKKRPEDVRKKARDGSILSKAPHNVFSRIVKILSKQCVFSTRQFDKLTDINRKDFYKPIKPRKLSGKPSSNADKSIYFFVNKVLGVELIGTRRDLALSINSEKYRSLLKQIHGLVNGTRLSVKGWELSTNKGTK